LKVHTEAGHHQRAGSAEGNERTGEVLAPARLLVVDDEETNVRLLERLLRRSGYSNVLTTTDPSEVLQLADTFEPDLVLLDLVMHPIDGIGVLTQLRAALPPDAYVPVVVLTADVTIEARRRALEAGADDFLTKPFDYNEVLLRVRNLLRTRTLHEDLRRERVELEERVEQRTAALQETMDRLRSADEARRLLLARLVRTQEEERRLIAADIHDDIVQVMTAVSVRLAVLRSVLPADDDRVAKLVGLEPTVAEAIARLRRLLFDLRPSTLDEHGLGAALLEVASRAEDEGMRIEVDDRLEETLPTETAVVLFRIAKEALANARKHAGASTHVVTIEDHESGCLLTVSDDGRGFDAETLGPQAGHLGLASMRERAEMAGGWLRIESSPGHGTRLGCWLPT
jgi:signal transduction histidine kinase